MFTGLVEAIGTVHSVLPIDSSSSGGQGFSLTIGECGALLTDCQLGDSICVNGACLTVTEFDKDSFKVGLAPETLNRTDLGQLKEGGKVNLERAMKTGDRYGGHFVQGHVDSTATIVSRVADGNSIRLTLKLSPEHPELVDCLVPKGYVALDGTSLTLTDINDAEATFGIMLIAHTQDKVVLTNKREGDLVNVEVDMVAKAVAKIVHKAYSKPSLDEQRVQAMVDASIAKALAQR